MTDTTALLLQLLDQHGARLYALLLKLTLREDAAEELLQDLFVRLNGSSGFARTPNHERYLFRSAINLAFDWRKQDAHWRTNAETFDRLEADYSTPLDRLVHREEIERILLVMERLTAASRELITSRFIDGLSYDELAKRFEVTPHHARAKLSRAIAELRKLVGSHSTH